MATIKLDLVPFSVPHSATISLPGHQQPRGPLNSQLSGYVNAPPVSLPSVPLKELAPEELESLANGWLNALFANVNRRNPFQLPNEKAPAKAANGKTPA